MPKEWKIRPITMAAELSLCAEMMSMTDPWKRFGYTKAECEQKLGDPAIRLDGAEAEDGALVGFLASTEQGVSFAPLMEYLCVWPQFRNRGVGTALVAFFERELYPDAANLFLFVSDINPDAARLYRRLGYLPVGALPDYNYQMQTEFIFRKSRGPKRKC